MKLIKKKKPATADIAKIAGLVKSVNDLKAMGLLQLEKETPDAYIYPEIWAGKDDDFKTNWCRNVFAVWCLTSGQPPEATDGMTMTVFDRERGDLLATYGHKEGFRGQ